MNAITSIFHINLHKKIKHRLNKVHKETCTLYESQKTPMSTTTTTTTNKALVPKFWGQLWILNILVRIGHMHSLPLFYSILIFYVTPLIDMSFHCHLFTFKSKCNHIKNECFTKTTMITHKTNYRLEIKNTRRPLLCLQARSEGCSDQHHLHIPPH